MNTIDDLLRDKEQAEQQINSVLKEFYKKYSEDIKDSTININFEKYKEDYEREYNISIKSEIIILL